MDGDNIPNFLDTDADGDGIPTARKPGLTRQSGGQQRRRHPGLPGPVRTHGAGTGGGAGRANSSTCR